MVSAGANGTAKTTAQLQSWGAAYQLNGGDGAKALGDLTAWRKASGTGENAGYPVFCAAGGHMDAASDWGEVGAWVDSFDPSRGGTKLKPAGDGAGTPYQISTPEAFAWFAYKVNSGLAAANQNAEITAPVSLAGEPYGGTAGGDFANCLKWVPATTFSGGFDGGNHGITDMNASIGLFNGLAAAGTLRNIAIESGRVLGTTGTNGSDTVYAGAVAKDVYGKVQHCSSKAGVTVDVADSILYVYVGGIAGYARSGAVVENCYSTGDVHAQRASAGGKEFWVAGLVGGTDSATVRNSYYAGKLTYSNSRISGVNAIANTRTGAKPANCFYDNTKTPVETGGTSSSGLATNQMQSWNTAYKLNGNQYVGSTDGTQPTSTVWTTDEQKNGKDLKNDGYPVFGDLKINELSVTLDPAKTVEGGGSTGGLLMAGVAPKALSGEVTLLEAPSATAGLSLGEASAVDAKFSTWGTDSANKAVALEAGSTSLTTGLAPGAQLSTNGLSGLTLHAGAAYNSGEKRSVSFALMDESAGYRVTATLLPVTSKTLDVTLPVETSPSFDLEPDGTVHEGDAAAKAKEPSTVVSNNGVPVVGHLESVAPLPVGTAVAAGDGQVSVELNPRPAADKLANTTDPIADTTAAADNVKLYAAASGGDASLTPLDVPLHFAPSDATVPLYFALPGNGSVKWKWAMDYTGTYLGATGVFGYSMGYTVGLPAADVDTASLNGTGYLVAPGVYATEPRAGGQAGRYNVEWNKSAS